MKTIAPSYYQKFKCIADKCKHSCCIGWEIDIDDDTFEYYKSIDGSFGKRLKENIDTEEDVSHFILDETERCPFLNKNGLCDIICTLGENSLCQICDDHPRYRNFYGDRTEIGVGLCCEEAARIIISNQDKTSLVTIDDDFVIGDEWEDEQEFLLFRQGIFDILQNRSLSIEQRIDNMLLKCNAKVPYKTFNQWIEVYLSLERLDKNWDTLLKNLKEYKFTDNLPIKEEWNIIFEQILIYFVYRHFTDSLDDGRLKERAVFVALSYEFIKNIFVMINENNGDIILEEMVDVVRMYSSETEYSVENMEKLFDIFSK